MLNTTYGCQDIHEIDLIQIPGPGTSSVISSWFLPFEHARESVIVRVNMERNKQKMAVLD